MEKNEKLALSVTETAEALGLSRPSVYRLLQREDFPVFQVGGRRLVSRRGLEEWIDKQAGKEVVCE